MPTNPAAFRTLARAIVAATMAAILLATPVSAAAAPGGAGPANPSGGGPCTITASGPFLYAGLVFPDVEVRCEQVQNRIRLDVKLTMDGAVAGQATRDCHKTDVCRQSVDARAFDVPGDQLWCGLASFSAHKTTGSTSSCESEPF